MIIHVIVVIIINNNANTKTKSIIVIIIHLICVALFPTRKNLFAFTAWQRYVELARW